MLRSSLCQGCDITDMTLGTGDPLPRYHPLSLSALSCVAIPTAATWSAHSIAVAHFFTMALHCQPHNFSLMILQDRSCKFLRTYIYGSRIVSAQGKILWTSGISLQPPCATHCSVPSLYRLLDTCFIYGLGKREDKSSPLGSNNLLQMAYSSLRFWSESVRTWPVNWTVFLLVWDNGSMSTVCWFGFTSHWNQSSHHVISL